MPHALTAPFRRLRLPTGHEERHAGAPVHPHTHQRPASALGRLRPSPARSLLGASDAPPPLPQASDAQPRATMRPK